MAPQLEHYRIDFDGTGLGKTIYFVLDAELSWSLLVEDVFDRLYITLGMFLLLVPLAITSTRDWIKRLGNKRWNALHWLIFPAVVLGLVHYYMAVKRDIREPLFYALIFAFLFWLRLRKPATSDRRSATSNS